MENNENIQQEQSDEHVIKEHVETEEEKYLRKMRKSFLRSFWRNVNDELPPRSGTFWANIDIETELCSVSHQDRVYFYYPEKKFMSDSIAKEGGKVTHWAYPLPQPKDIIH